ncbi:MAG TPA: LacI family DNA-binding transcriptional regulator [Jatrophihabitans sp.]|uniref:LacI family DNA-binding transcriptional regulator n=1 Tax=Jatrophihabitans sp. TaxID=1932789 RepID=UPI002E0268F7|nr:LacI family DNA-binding transcriptional regulator [Jatrophihabitans sp.]
MSVTSRDVARLAGVSQPTVSRALRGDGRIAEATRARIEQVAAELGYVPSEPGRSLSTRSTRQIAMVADFENPLYPTLVGPLHDTFAEHGYRMVLLAERGDDQVTYARLLDRSVDGAVLTTTLVDSSLSQLLIDRRLPFVELNRRSGLPGANSLTADNEGGAASCAELLVGLGHRRIGAIFGQARTSTARDRENGFRSALGAAGLALADDHVSRGSFAYEDGVRGLSEIMSSPTPPTAIFCGNDMVAVGALNQALNLGIDVPGDVSIVGFDDLAIASWPCFRVTTVRVDLASMARAAAEAIVGQLQGRRVVAAKAYPTELVLRRTHASIS